jgi:hypothetical protein
MPAGNDVTVTWLCLNNVKSVYTTYRVTCKQRWRLCASNLNLICYGNMKLFASLDICSYYEVVSDRLSGFVYMT